MQLPRNHPAVGAGCAAAFPAWLSHIPSVLMSLTPDLWPLTWGVPICNQDAGGERRSECTCMHGCHFFSLRIFFRLLAPGLGKNAADAGQWEQRKTFGKIFSVFFSGVWCPLHPKWNGDLGKEAKEDSSNPSGIWAWQEIQKRIAFC